MALCLSSSFLGFFAHTGFLDGLLQQGIRPGHISGCSSGGYIAGLHASGMSTEAMTSFLLARGMVNSFWEWGFPFRGLAMCVNLKGFNGLSTGRRAVDYLRPHLEGRRIEDCRHPRLGIAVSNLREGKADIAESGPLLEYMIATCAMPCLIAARKIGENHYWDGALGNPAPITHWVNDPVIETILIHQIITKPEMDARSSATGLSIHHAFNLGFQVANNRVVELSIQLARQAGKRVEIIETHTARPRFHQTLGQREKLVEAGKRSAAAQRELMDSVRGLAAF